MNKRLVWITGARGLIGNYLVHSQPTSASDLQVKAWTRSDLDLRDLGATERAFSAQQPWLVIHCAALSKSPACQADPALAREVNVTVTQVLSELCAKSLFVFISTDLVFDGQKGNYDESAKVNPLTVYAETKAKAEEFVLRNPMHLVIRTSLNGGVSPTRDRGFNEEMRIAWTAGKTLSFFVDEFRCPIGAAVTARAIWEIALQGANGIYHVAGAERLSRLQIGELLAARYSVLKPKFRSGSLTEYSGAPRSPDTSLNCSKAQGKLSFPLPRFGEWLRQQPKDAF